jgi:Leucine-rich repeat (LRR) protein
MSGLVKLKLFHMGHIGVQTLPEDFGHLQNLVDLHLYGCKNLQTLPEDFGHLQNLVHLHLYGCKNLQTLPQSFGSLQLQTLHMNDNPKLEMLPEGFGRLKSLVDLHIGNNPILPLPFSELPLNLSVLDLTGSKSVTRISPKNSNDEVQTLQIGGMMH